VVEVTRCTAFDFLAFVHFLEVLCCRGFLELSELCRKVVETAIKGTFRDFVVQVCGDVGGLRPVFGQSK